MKIIYLLRHIAKLMKILSSLFIVFILSSCSTVKYIDLENYIGLYEVVGSKCDVSSSSVDPCDSTLFIEIVKGQFMGVSDSELTYVFWSGYPKIDSELQYSSHLIKKSVLNTRAGNKYWLSDDGDTKEYFQFSGGQLTGYYAKYIVNDKGEERVVQYVLKPANRGNLPHVRLNYPGNKE